MVFSCLWSFEGGGGQGWGQEANGFEQLKVEKSNGDLYCYQIRSCHLVTVPWLN